MELEGLKERYNKVLEREKKAEKWMETAPIAKIEKWMPDYLEITRQLSGMMQEFRQITGRSMTQEECLEGLK